MQKALTPIRSYSGLRGCMCGCLGTYTEVEKEPAKVYAKLAQVLRHPKVQYDENAKCYYYETKTRNNVVYMKEI